MRNWQARLAMKQDRIKRKIIDLQIEHEGVPTDCIRIRLKKDDEGDIQTRTIEMADVIPVVFPPLTDVPYRRLGPKLDGGWEITSLPDAAGEEAKKFYEIVVPHTAYLRPDDLIIRVMLDDDAPDHPVILALQVLESTGDFGGSMLIKSKYKTNLYNEDLSQNTLAIIAAMAERRLKLGY